MRITGYRTLTEKERDYLTIHRLLRKYKISPESINKFLDPLKVSPAVIVPTSLFVAHDETDRLQFCVVEASPPNYLLHLSQLPENTTSLFIETK